MWCRCGYSNGHTEYTPDTQSPTFYLLRITFEFWPHRANWTVQRRQFPLRLAYATTFNSCQGLTLDRVVLDLTIPVLAHGQLYTSLSRVRSAVDIRILRGPNEIDQLVLCTTNCYYISDDDRPGNCICPTIEVLLTLLLKLPLNYCTDIEVVLSKDCYVKYCECGPDP